MPLDPEIETLVAAWYALELRPVEEQTAIEVRRAYAALDRPAVALPVDQEDRWIDGSGGRLRVRVYRPNGGSPRGALVYFHGGGWVVGTLDTHDGHCQRICHGADCVVVSVDYPLAPEHPYPAAINDGYAALCWVAGEAASLGIAPKRIGVGGDSAGANIAAGLALMARDRGGPALGLQLLVYPVVDDDFTRASCLDNAEGYVLRLAALKWYWQQYAPERAQRESPYCRPLRAPSLRGLPRALVITAEFDPLRDEGLAYAERLAQSGVSTTSTCYAGAIHGFFGKDALSALAREAMAQACAEIRATLGA